MKKLLAICSIFFSICTCFTACGSEDAGPDGDGGRSETYRSEADSRTSGNDAGDHVDDAIDGVGDAGGELIEGVTDAADDIIDGLDGDEDDDEDSHKHRSSRVVDEEDDKSLTTTTKSWLTDGNTR